MTLGRYIYIHVAYLLPQLDCDIEIRRCRMNSVKWCKTEEETPGGRRINNSVVDSVGNCFA